MKILNFLQNENLRWERLLGFLKEQKLLLIFFLVLLGICILGFQTFIVPEIDRMIALRGKLNKINERLFNLQKELVSHPSIQREAQILNKQFELLQEKFPPERRFLSLAQEVLSGLESEGIKIINFKYLYDLKEQASPDFKKYGLVLKVFTDYIKLGRFLESMEDKGLKFCIDKISISRLSDQGLDIELKLVFILRREK